MSEQSVSRVGVRFIVESGGEAQGELVRHLSPRTVDTIIRRLPLEGRSALRRGEVYFQVQLALGLEKPKKVVEMGQLAYWPYADALSVFLVASQLQSPVSIVGSVTSGLKLFTELKSGTKITMKKD